MKRLIIAAAVLVCAVVGAVPTAAVAAPATSTHPIIIFDDTAQQAELIIPTPACPTTQPGCEWKFFLNAPKLSIDFATVYGTSGTLVIPYPKHFCGVIQADAYIGPPWVAQRGFQHTITSDCAPPPPVTPPVKPPSTPAPVSPAPVSPPEAIVPTNTAPAPAPVPPTVAATSEPVAPAVGTPKYVAATGAQQQDLPFTGLNVALLLLVGSGLVALGIGLLTRRRRRI